MTKISTRATKTEILAAYEAAQAELKRHQAGEITWAQIGSFLTRRCRQAWAEARMLVSDVQKLGSLARQWVSLVVDTYSKPVLRSRA